MDRTDIDIYEEYPELREYERRRTAVRRKKRPMNNSGKLLVLLLVIAVAASALALVLSLNNEVMAFVYAKDGSNLEVREDEVQKYLDEGYYASPADLTPVTMYAEDGTVITACLGDVDKLAEKGYTTDKSAVYTNMYSDDGRTLYVPNSMAAVYKANGWHDRLSDIVVKMYKSDGSTITVPRTEIGTYAGKGWTDKLLTVAKMMNGPEGEEKMVFNDEVNAYLDNGWTVAKRVIDPDQPMVALTFDDGPGKYTDDLLSCLDKNNSAATFFVLGQLAEKFPDVVKRADELGCEIANHTWDHLNATEAGAAAAEASVAKTSDAVKAIIGKPTYTYRPCYGAYNQDVLAEVNLPAIMWSIDTLDWKTKNAESTYKTVMDKVYDGAIILMHDIHEPTVEAAKRMIPELVNEGYQLVTVSELLKYRCGGAENAKVYFDINEIK